MGEFVWNKCHSCGSLLKNKSKIENWRLCGTCKFVNKFIIFIISSIIIYSFIVLFSNNNFSDVKFLNTLGLSLDLIAGYFIINGFLGACILDSGGLGGGRISALLQKVVEVSPMVQRPLPS